MSVKDVLYAWLGKNKKGNPVYDVQNGLRNRFKCELRVAGYSYIAMGNSTNKKDASTNAAMDFCNFLVRQGEMKPDEVPSLNSGSLESTTEMPGNSGFGAAEGSFFNGPPAQQAPPPRLNNNFTSHDQYVTQRAEEVAQSESVDLKAEIHGGWTVENSKQALNEFLQKTRQLAATYKTERKEANANISGFTSTISVYIPQLSRNLNAQGQGSTKKVAEANCAMSMVRQLYHQKILAEYQGARKKTKLPEIPVEVPEALASRVKEYVARQGVTPVGVDQTAATPDEPKSLVVDHRLAHFPDSEITPPCNVSWSPPMQNWNPWRSCNIDEEPLAFMTLPEINDRVGMKEADKGASQVNAVRSQLPVAQFRQQIIDTVAGNRVTLIKGETGCGKSTQVAQYLLESYIDANRGGEFNAYVSQPRRISAISLAERVATERNEQLGDSVGYGVRFDAVLPRPYGSIFFCTVGVLLRKMESGLRGVSHVIIDEIHERDIDTDFVLIVLREMVREFPDLRVVLMSATIDTKMFTEYFGACPVIEMHGRTHPVQSFFLEEIVQMLEFMPPEPLKPKDEDPEDEECDSKNLNILPVEADPMLRQAMSRIRENDIPYDIIEKILLDIGAKGEDGAVLIFLPGWQEIMTLMNQLTTHPIFSDASKYVILPLHSLLTAAEQRRVFDHFGEGVRKIILSTNIAETSVTIDDVVYVIDSCKSRERLYSTSNNMVHYATVWASRSNMAQRRGRAGRVRPGFAFHLCSKARFEALDEHRTAEILRTPLYAVALTIKLLRLGSVGEFLAKAIEPPPCDMVVESEAVLKNMGALDRNLELTALGRILARLPIEPGIGKTIVMGLSLGVGSLMCELAAASSFSAPFVPRERTHTRLSGPQRSFAGSRWSDHISLICVNQAFSEASEQRSEDSFCQRFSLNKPALKMTNGAKRQLLETLTAQCGFPMEAVVPIYADPNGVDQNLDLLTSLLVASYYPNIAFYKGKRKVYTLEQASALVTKMSILTPFRGDVINLPSPLIVFSEKVRTRCISCKELTVVNAAQLILFGCRKVECVGQDLVRLDDMITVKMNVEVAAALIALRPCIERHLIMACTNPESLMAQSDDDRELIALLRELSSPSLFAEAGPKDYLITEQALQGLQPVNNTNGSNTNRGRGRGFRGGGGSWGYGNRGGQRGGGFGAPRQEGFGGAGFGDAPRYQGGPPPAQDGPQRGFGFSYGNQTPGFGRGGRGGFSNSNSQGGFGFANGDAAPAAPPGSGGFGRGGGFNSHSNGGNFNGNQGGFGFANGDAPPPASGGFGGGGGSFGGFGGQQQQPQQQSLQPPPFGGKWPSPRRDGGYHHDRGAARPYQNRGRGGGGGGGRGRGGGGRGFRGGWF